MIADVPYPTGTVQVEIDQAGIPQYEIKENVAWDNIPYTAHLEALAGHYKGCMLPDRWLNAMSFLEIL